MSKTNYELAVEPRSEMGSAAVRRLRKAGKIPAVIYSHGAETQPLLVDAGEWKALSKHDFNLLTLRQGRKKTAAVVKEVQENFLKSQVTHIDFQEVKMDEKITASIPVRPSHGDIAGVSKGGILEQAIHEIEVSCLPGDLPEHFDVDITALEIGESLHIGEIVMPENVELVSDPELVAFHITKPISEAAAAAEEAAKGEEAAEAENAEAQE
ncbi:MAG: 50S ribosomal protein L25 [Victivallaceae bacterium]|nr:50S ribosomal protein L25 [Victivallaceae bacterium]